jgi:glutamine amidotransferase
MGRLVCYLGGPTSPAPLVFGGANSLYRQSCAPREMLSGSINADGFGVVWYHHGIPRRVTQPRPIWHDSETEGLLESVSSPCVLAAVGASDPGGDGSPRTGLLPLVHERWSFVLDGFVPDFRRRHMRLLRQRLSDDLYASLEGASEAETLFLLAVQDAEGGDTSLSGALERVAALVMERVGKKQEAQLNMVLSDGTRVGILRTSTVLLTNSLYMARYQSVGPEGIVVASERLDPASAWEAVDGHHRVELGPDGVEEVEPVFL